MLKYNGFDVEAKFGDYDGKLFESAYNLQILVCGSTQ